jgi:cytochrome c-type biogenesis protein
MSRLLAVPELTTQTLVLFALLGGLATSLGPCTLARTMMLAGAVGVDARTSRSRGLMLSLLFLLGMAVTYTLLGLVGGAVTAWTRLAESLYLPLGLAIVAFGLHQAGVIRIPLPHAHALTGLSARLAEKGGSLSTTLLGGLSAFLVCPCCLPGLLAIFAFTYARGDLGLGVVGTFAFTFGHGVPLLLVGTFVGALSRLKTFQRYYSYVEVASGTFLVAAGLLLVWIA